MDPIKDPEVPPTQILVSSATAILVFIAYVIGSARIMQVPPESPGIAPNITPARPPARHTSSMEGVKNICNACNAIAILHPS